MLSFKTFGRFRAGREAGLRVVGGFHSPIVGITLEKSTREILAGLANTLVERWDFVRAIRLVELSVPIARVARAMFSRFTRSSRHPVDHFVSHISGIVVVGYGDRTKHT